MRQRDHDPDVARLVNCFEFAERELKALLRETRSLKNRHERVGRELSQVATRLEGDIQNARLVPAESVFEGFHKMMRDLAAEEGKKLEFRMTGLAQEADRFVLQELKDPLMHLLRNTLAHGIELPADRVAAGKEAAGKVTVRLESLGNRLTLTLEDDGRGINRARILEVAIAQGLLNAEQAARLKPDQVAPLIFRAGFSTSPGVDNLSGRGMGLSVVEETVKRLAGEVGVSSEVGQGCRFTLSVPIAIASHRVVLARSGAMSLAFPCHNLEGLLRLKRSELRTIDGAPAIFFRGEPVALASAAQILGGSDARASAQNFMSVLILRFNGKRLAVLVDELLAERNAVIKKMPTPELAAISYFRGAVILEDGTVSLVVDVRGLVERKGQEIAFAEAEERVDANATGAMPRILVVDDSFTTRTLEKSILEANGYEVTLAVDGVEALQKLLSGAFDLVISDVEMPRMDGFTLLAEIKKHPRLSSLPVIMVTSLEKNEDKQRGLDLGADAYLPKQKFDQGNLLDVVRQIL
jgi:two-component system chemotaxis sensor kinase CheA